MKKPLFFIFAMFMFLDVVNALEWQDEPLEGGDVETETRYRFYKEKRVGEFLSFNEDNDYQYFDIDNFILSDYSDYKSICNEDEIDIEYKTKYIYKKLLPVKYIKIINEDADVIEIRNILITNIEDIIDYNILNCSDCSNDYKFINPTGELILELKEEQFIEDIDLEIIFNNSDKGLNHRLDYSYTDSFDNKNMIALTRSSTKVFKYHVNNTFYVYKNYSNNVYTDYDIIENKYIKVLSKEEVCRSKEKLIYYYNIEKEYYDNNYYKDIKDLNLSFEEEQNYIKDETQYKTFYRFINNTEKIDNNVKTNEENNFKDNDELKLVKTGYEESKNYLYLNLYILILFFIMLICVKRIKKMSIKNKF